MEAERREGSTALCHLASHSYHIMLYLPSANSPSVESGLTRGRHGRTEQSHLETTHTHYTQFVCVYLARRLGPKVVKAERRADEKVPPRNGLKANNQ